MVVAIIVDFSLDRGLNEFVETILGAIQGNTVAIDFRGGFDEHREIGHFRGCVRASFGFGIDDERISPNAHSRCDAHALGGVGFERKCICGCLEVWIRV